MKTNQKKHKIQKFGSTESQHVKAVADDVPERPYNSPTY